MREMNLNEGTSKGKGADPQNWGNAMIEDEDLDLEEQRAALESFKTAKEIASQTESSSEEEACLLNKGSGPYRRWGLDICEQAAREQCAINNAVKRTEDRLRKEYDLKLKEALADMRTSAQQVHQRRPKERLDNPVENLVRNIVNPKTSQRERRHTPDTMEPVRQVAPKSYIGQALGRLANGHDDESDSSSSSSSSSSLSTSSSSDTSHNEAR
jgi:hypothetical protein